jgi:hypothetical protein
VNGASSARRAVPRRLAWVALFAAGALLRTIGIAHTVTTSVLNMPLPDDAFYYFMLARNLAEGHGPVISGDGAITTGFQPLWGLTLGALNALTGGLGPTTLVHAAQAIGAVAGLVAGWLLVMYARELGAGGGTQFLVAGAYLLSPQVVKHNLNGLETAFAFAGLAGLGLIFLRSSSISRSAGSGLVLGVAGGLAALARLDLLIFIACAGLISGPRAILRAEPRQRLPVIRRWAAFAAGVLLPLVPWWAFTFHAGAGLVPESGPAVRHLSLMVRHMPLLEPLPSLIQAPAAFAPYYAQNIAEFTSGWIRQTPALLPVTIPLFAAFGTEAAVPLSALLAIPVVAAAGWWSWKSGKREMQVALLHWFVFAAVSTIAYAIFIQGPWFYQRYAAPLAVLASPLLIATAARSIPSSKVRRTVGYAATAAVAASFAVLMWKGSYTWIPLGTRAVPADGFYQAAEALAEGMPPDSRVGVFSAGLIGYYAPQPVVALDGKVNAGAARALVAGTMTTFLCQDEVEYVVDWPKMVRSLLERRSKNWRTDTLDEVERIVAPGYNDIVIYRFNRDVCVDGAGSPGGSE